jgi:hypothetical protein
MSVSRCTLGCMTEKMRLSHSQSKSLGCSLSWYISRRARMPGTTYWSTIAGSVFHQRVEEFLLTGSFPDEPVAEHVQRLVDEHLWDTPFTEEDIRVSKQLPSGLKAAEHPNGFDKAAVVAVVPHWIGRWRKWLDDQYAAGWRLWEAPDPEHGGATVKGVEVEVTLNLAGHPVVGSIDCVLVHDDGRVWLLDWKAGRSKPDDTSQLDLYRIGFTENYGIVPAVASFLMIRTMREHGRSEAATFTRADLEARFAEAGQRAADAEEGRFMVDYTKCEYLCSVRYACPLRNGAYAGMVEFPPNPVVLNA